MKCVCGYEQEMPFEKYSYTESTWNPHIGRIVTLPHLYVCPKCGTVKMEKVKKTDD